MSRTRARFGALPPRGEHSRRARPADAGYDSSAVHSAGKEATLRHHRLFAWLLTLFWVSTIWNLGGEGFSMTSTSRFLGPLLSWLAPGWSPEQSLHAQVLVRKAAHVGEYGVLCLLLGRALALSLRLRMRFVAAGTVLSVSALATADEMRQASVTARTGSWSDVLLDASGGIAALGLLFVVRRWLGRPLFQRAESRPEHA